MACLQVRPCAQTPCSSSIAVSRLARMPTFPILLIWLDQSGITRLIVFRLHHGCSSTSGLLSHSITHSIGSYHINAYERQAFLFHTQVVSSVHSSSCYFDSPALISRQRHQFRNKNSATSYPTCHIAVSHLNPPHTTSLSLYYPLFKKLYTSIYI